MSSAAARESFDPEFLRRKYAEEREKRLRSDGIDQYQALTGEFAGFLDDPHVDEVVERAPIEEELDVVVIGGGFSGLSAGAQLGPTRAMVLASAIDTCFCAGADLKERRGFTPQE